jgi:heme exporter protein C
MSLTIYSFMTILALLILVWRLKLAEILLKVSVSIGLSMTFIALVTGSLWGKPMWGTAWIWDARLTSELVLFFLYFAILALFNAIRDSSTAARITAIIVLLGAVDVPIVHYSVNWWNTLHQGSTISRFSKPAMDNLMLYPLLLMIAGFFTYTFSLIFYRAKTEILHREKNAQWVQQLFRHH